MEGSLSTCWLTSLVPVKRYDHVAKSDLRKKIHKRRLNTLTVLKVFTNKSGQVVKNFSHYIRIVFVWFRESNEI